MKEQLDASTIFECLFPHENDELQVIPDVMLILLVICKVKSYFLEVVFAHVADVAVLGDIIFELIQLVPEFSKDIYNQGLNNIDDHDIYHEEKHELKQQETEVVELIYTIK